MIKSKVYGHDVYYDNTSWRWSDNNEIVGNDKEKKCCPKCGEYPSTEGHDFCISNLGKVVSACCGHGVKEGYLKFEDGTIIRGHFEIERRNQ